MALGAVVALCCTPLSAAVHCYFKGKISDRLALSAVRIYRRRPGSLLLLLLLVLLLPVLLLLLPVFLLLLLLLLPLLLLPVLLLLLLLLLVLPRVRRPLAASDPSAASSDVPAVSRRPGLTPRRLASLVKPHQKRARNG